MLAHLAAPARSAIERHESNMIDCEWLLRQVKSGDAARAFTITGLERRTLNSQLRYAFDHALWPEAQRIGRLLNEYWDAQGLEEEARSWVDRVWLLAAGPDGAPPSLDSPAGALWLVFIGGQAMRELRLVSHLQGTGVARRNPGRAARGAGVDGQVRGAMPPRTDSGDRTGIRRPCAPHQAGRNGRPQRVLAESHRRAATRRYPQPR